MPAGDLRPPRQERTQAAWERILDAGVAILDEHGYEGFTIASICARAGVTPPTIYARVRGKEALFFAVFEHGFEPVRRRQQEELTAAGTGTVSPQDAVRQAITAIVTTTLVHERFLRTIVHRAEDDDEIARRTRDARAGTATRFRELVLRHPEALRDAAPERIDRCFRVVFAALMARVAFGTSLDIGAETSDAEFLSDLQEIALRTLFRETAAS
ncbi:hypothetical protein GCM10011512_09360 [Tersicoccus solisilvae]|uniref:HTH tetR-type domain-containing protein n=1 Tax=Tersicoccus solisilvae TaxID=1882339 RepID=A0ABQ1NT92_9MICC|nr:TetR/AcrR family transcriptional regulator [Tersicoccus solisilvae]GGC84618.1 hypothetical protein GCM10011512_09360 [Tersicoccus solisilvae]